MKANNVKVAVLENLYQLIDFERKCSQGCSEALSGRNPQLKVPYPDYLPVKQSLDSI